MTYHNRYDLRAALSTCINQQKIDSKVASLMLHVPGEADEIAPISAIILLLEMATFVSDIINMLIGISIPFQPSMSIRGMQEVQFAPCQRSPWSDCGALSTRLHSSDIADMVTMTVFTSENRDRSTK